MHLHPKPILDDQIWFGPYVHVKFSVSEIIFSVNFHLFSKLFFILNTQNQLKCKILGIRGKSQKKGRRLLWILPKYVESSIASQFCKF